MWSGNIRLRPRIISEQTINVAIEISDNFYLYYLSTNYHDKINYYYLDDFVTDFFNILRRYYKDSDLLRIEIGEREFLFWPSNDLDCKFQVQLLYRYVIKYLIYEYSKNF